MTFLLLQDAVVAAMIFTCIPRAEGGTGLYLGSFVAFLSFTRKMVEH
jgi:hypothetical protein